MILLSEFGVCALLSCVEWHRDSVSLTKAARAGFAGAMTPFRANQGLWRQPNCPGTLESAEHHSGHAQCMVLEQPFQTEIFKYTYLGSWWDICI